MKVSRRYSRSNIDAEDGNSVDMHGIAEDQKFTDKVEYGEDGQEVQGQGSSALEAEVLSSLIDRTFCLHDQGPGFFISPQQPGVRLRVAVESNAVICFTDGSGSQSFTLYAIDVCSLHTEGVPVRWRTLKRFSEFAVLQDVLRRNASAFNISSIPSLPPKQLTQNQHPTVLLKRQQGLQDFLNYLLGIPTLCASGSPLLDFLEVDLFSAAQQGDLKLLQTLLSSMTEAAHLQAHSHSQGTLLHYAAANGQEHVVDWLLSPEANNIVDPAARDWLGCTAGEVAAHLGTQQQASDEMSQYLSQTWMNCYCPFSASSVAFVCIQQSHNSERMVHDCLRPIAALSRLDLHVTTVDGPWEAARHLMAALSDPLLRPSRVLVIGDRYMHMEAIHTVADHSARNGGLAPPLALMGYEATSDRLPAWQIMRQFVNNTGLSFHRRPVFHVQWEDGQVYTTDDIRFGSMRHFLRNPFLSLSRALQMAKPPKHSFRDLCSVTVSGASFDESRIPERYKTQMQDLPADLFLSKECNNNLTSSQNSESSLGDGAATQFSTLPSATVTSAVDQHAYDSVLTRDGSCWNMHCCLPLLWYRILDVSSSVYKQTSNRKIFDSEGGFTEEEIANVPHLESREIGNQFSRDLRQSSAIARLSIVQPSKGRVLPPWLRMWKAGFRMMTQSSSKSSQYTEPATPSCGIIETNANGVAIDVSPQTQSLQSEEQTRISGKCPKFLCFDLGNNRLDIACNWLRVEFCESAISVLADFNT